MVAVSRPTAQCGVPVDHGAQQQFQSLPGGVGGQPDGLGLREPAGVPVGQQPVPGRRQRDRPVVLGVRLLGPFVGVDGGGQLAHGGAFQHQPGPHRDSAPAHGLHHRQRDDAVQPEVQEVGVDVARGGPQFARTSARRSRWRSTVRRSVPPGSSLGVQRGQGRSSSCRDVRGIGRHR
jgi:hypothetical protein